MGPLKLEDPCLLFFASLPDRLRRRSGHASHICVKLLPSQGSITLPARARARVGSLHSLRFASAQTRRPVKADKADTPPSSHHSRLFGRCGTTAILSPG